MYIHGEEKIIFCTSEAIGNVCVIVRNIATAQGKLATYCIGTIGNDKSHHQIKGTAAREKLLV